MLVYKYSKWMYLIYFLFLPTSVFLYSIVLLVLLSISPYKLLDFVVVLACWVLLNVYLLLLIARSRMIISNDSLVFMSGLSTVEIPFQRVLAYKSYEIDARKKLGYYSIEYLLFPVDRFQKWIEIHYKDFKGHKKLLKQDITNFAHCDELIKNLDFYLKK